MFKDFVPPAWVQRVVVVADAGFAANETLRLITTQRYSHVFAMPRTRKFTNGKHLRDLRATFTQELLRSPRQPQTGWAPP
jgi:hypothetical protein